VEKIVERDGKVIGMGRDQISIIVTKWFEIEDNLKNNADYSFHWW
jgi:hypothetical protein